MPPLCSQAQIQEPDYVSLNCAAWERDQMYLCLCFLICKIGRIIVPSQRLL